MTVPANKSSILIHRFQLAGEVQTQTLLVVAFSAGSDGHVGSQAAESGSLSDIDMTRRAFRNVLFAGMAEPHRDSLRRDDYGVGCSALVTSRTVAAHRSLCFPVAVIAGCMTYRNGFEHCPVRNK